LTDRKVRKIRTGKSKPFSWYPLLFWITAILFLVQYFYHESKYALDFQAKDAIIDSHVATIEELKSKVATLENRPPEVVTKVEKVYEKVYARCKSRGNGFINIPERRGTQIR